MTALLRQELISVITWNFSIPNSSQPSWQCQKLQLSTAIFTNILKKVLYDAMCYKNVKSHYGILHLINRTQGDRMDLILILMHVLPC